MALFDFRVNGDISVLVGCGLGGTSLINANVCLRPEARVFADPCWPAELRADVDTRLAAGFSRAEAMLRPAQSTPRAWPSRPS
jgi:cholesterol oxidase